jgi:hypothetical protein
VTVEHTQRLARPLERESRADHRPHRIRDPVLRFAKRRARTTTEPTDSRLSSAGSAARVEQGAGAESGSQRASSEIGQPDREAALSM